MTDIFLLSPAHMARIAPHLRFGGQASRMIDTTHLIKAPAQKSGCPRCIGRTKAA